MNFRYLFLALALFGCGRTALGHTYETLGMGHLAHKETVSFVRAQLRETLEAECGSQPSPALRLTCGQEVAEDFRAREVSIHASADTIDTLAFAVLSWARAVAADEADEERPPFAVCEALSRLVSAIESWTRVAGETLPIEPWSCPGYSPEETDQ